MPFGLAEREAIVMAKGFDKKISATHLAGAASLLYGVSAQKGQPLVVPMYPEGNELGLEPGQIQPGRSELSPSCDGLVFAVKCSADEAQELFDLVFRWEVERREKGGDRT